MDSKNIITVFPLQCGYLQPEGTFKSVLSVKDTLEFKGGNVYFLIGASGLGKSTFLETLGLMNNTLGEKEESKGKQDILLHLGKQGAPISYRKMWDKKGENTLAEVRRNHLSFIFQETNLMENFSTYENIQIASMIQGQQTEEEELTKIKALMTEINLPPSRIPPERPPAKLSGGERQRVAFVRALTPRFTALFCDEPTGNLDEKNAHELMKMLVDHIGPEQIAFIVSHDIDLAMEFADYIIVGYRDEKLGYGSIDNDHIYHNEIWRDKGDEESKAFRHTLASFYENEGGELIDQQIGTNKVVKEAIGKNERIIHSFLIENEREEGEQSESAVKDQTGNESNYLPLFFRKEGFSLAGKQLRNFVWLISMLFATLLVIGFANGGRSYLQTKMNDPFVQWLNINVPWAKSDVSKLMRSLNDEDIKDRFRYVNVKSYVERPYQFWNEKRSDYFRAKGRSIDALSAGSIGSKIPTLLEDILASDNLLYGDPEGFSDITDLGLIVSKRFLHDFGYPEDASFVKMEYYDPISEVSYRIPISVKAIVKEIPGKNSFICTSCFAKEQGNKEQNTFDITLYKKNISFFIPFPIEEVDEDDLKQRIEAFLKEHEEYNRYTTGVDEFDFIKPNNETHILGTKGVIYLDGDLSTVGLRDSLFNELSTYKALIGYKMSRVYDYESQGICSLDEDAQNISVYFEELDSVRRFSDYLFNEFNTAEENSVIEVDVAKIKEKENFFFLSKVTKAIIILLIFFGALSVSLFVSNLLKMHLEKIKMNLGTLMAFGLNWSQTLKTYLGIVTLFVLAGLLVGGVIALITGIVLDFLLSPGIVDNEQLTFFQLGQSATIWAILIMLISAITLAGVTMVKLLNRTPGDLIYNR